LASVIVSFLLIIFSAIIYFDLQNKPSRFRAAIEEMFIFMTNLAESVGGKKSREFVPLVLTLFFFILLSNWIGLMPGFGSILLNKFEDGHTEEIPLFRGATADLNTTLALAVISFLFIQYYGFAKLKLGYLKKFFNFKSPIDFFTGILELISEFTKIISFSFRLFGNIFAGEVLLAVVVSLVPVIAPLPFVGLEIFVGFIQALVFAMLTLVFIQMATLDHSENNEEHKTYGKEVA
jgi:F-type H+-transporting ATPase subunit a